MKTVDLSGAWSFAFTDNTPTPAIQSIDDVRRLRLTSYRCEVPGNFELDLSANDLFHADPFFGLNIVDASNLERQHVWYFREFPMPDLCGARAVAVFEGIDCFADIFVNGHLAGSTDNMLIEHEFDVTDLLQKRNEIVIHITPVGEVAARHSYSASAVTMAHRTESLWVRKAPHMFGWDIMPRALSAGLWRPARLELRPAERIAAVYLATAELTKDLSSASLLLHYEMELSKPARDYSVRITGNCRSSRFQAEARLMFRSGHVSIVVSDPDLWWPRGRGRASLYDIQVELLRAGEVVDATVFRHGIRTVNLERTDTTDREGNGEFCFYVNHERFFAKGTNWVPADAFHSRDRARIPQIVDLVEDVGCNMIRCWGGNVYEDDLFYDLCDEKGLLVWQDFAMACEIYPQGVEFAAKLADEVRSVVRRLRRHACIALWAGDNECDEAWHYPPVRIDPNNNVLTRVTIPAVLRDEDSFRPYLPSSPYISPEVFTLGRTSMPEAHLWDVRHDYRSEYFKNADCHFVSEVGFLGCPSVSSLRRFIPQEALWPYMDNPYWTLHATSPVPGVDLFDYRVQLLALQTKTVFGTVPDNLEEFVIASQICQAEGLKFIIERFRSRMWRRTGVLWWNIMDGWPQFSDAVVDYYFDKKLAYGFIKRSQAPVCLLVREEDGGSEALVAASDLRGDVSLQFQVTDVASEKLILEGSANAAANSVTVAAPLPTRHDKAQGMYRISWTSGGSAHLNHYLYGRPPFELQTYQRLLALAYEPHSGIARAVAADMDTSP